MENNKNNASMAIMNYLLPNKGDKVTFGYHIPLDDAVTLDSVILDVKSIRNSGNGLFIVSSDGYESDFSKLSDHDQQVLVAKAVMFNSDSRKRDAHIAAMYDVLDRCRSVLGDEYKLFDGFILSQVEEGEVVNKIKYDKENNSYYAITDKDNWYNLKYTSIDNAKSMARSSCITMIVSLIPESNQLHLDKPITLTHSYDIGDYKDLFVVRDIKRDIEYDSGIVPLGDYIHDDQRFENEDIESSEVRQVFSSSDLLRLYDHIKLQQELSKTMSEGKAYDNIEYDGKKWPVRSIILPSTGEEVLVGTVALEQALLPDDGHTGWKDRKAETVDERIFYYATEDEFSLSSEELAAFIENVMDINHDQDNNEEVSLENIEEDRLLSDEDIKKQYSDFKVTGIKFYKQTQPDAWSGVVDLEFPNANHPDFDESMTNPFISYDKEGKNIAFEKWMSEETYNGVCAYIRQERPKYLVVEAIIERTTDTGAKAFTPEQQKLVLDYLKCFETTDQKILALSPLWEKAKEDDRMKNVVGFWKDDTKEELNDLASGIIRDNSRGLTP